MSTTGISGAQEGQKSMSHALEQKLQEVVSHHIGAKSQTMSSSRAASILNPQGISPALDPAEEILAYPKFMKKPLLCYLLT